MKDVIKNGCILRNLAVIIVLLTGCTRKRHQELSTRVNAYAHAWHSKDLNGVWSLMSPSLRRQNDGNPENMRKAVADPLEETAITPISIKQEGEVGAVVVVFSRWSVPLKSSVCELEEERWVRQNGEWFFESHHSLEPNATH